MSVSSSVSPLIRASLWTGVLVLIAGIISPSFAEVDANDQSPHSEATLGREHNAIVPGGTFAVALRLTMEEGGHNYWKNSGASGEPTSIDW